jgi:hypothetical protein
VAECHGSLSEMRMRRRSGPSKRNGGRRCRSQTPSPPLRGALWRSPTSLNLSQPLVHHHHSYCPLCVAPVIWPSERAIECHRACCGKAVRQLLFPLRQGYCPPMVRASETSGSHVHQNFLTVEAVMSSRHCLNRCSDQGSQYQSDAIRRAHPLDLVMRLPSRILHALYGLRIFHLSSTAVRIHGSL